MISRPATRFHPVPPLAGAYELYPLDTLDVTGARQAQVGVVRFGAGHRSPPEGFRTSAAHELATLLEGRVRVDLPDGASRIVGPGEVIVSSPAEAHATTALEDTVILYVLVG